MGKKVYVDLTHPFSAEIPRWPYFDKPEITNAHTMAKGGVLTSKITCTMHTGTHCDAPRHVMEYEFDGRRARSSFTGITFAGAGPNPATLSPFRIRGVPSGRNKSLAEPITISIIAATSSGASSLTFPTAASSVSISK